MLLDDIALRNAKRFSRSIKVRSFGLLPGAPAANLRDCNPRRPNGPPERVHIPCIRLIP
jgi:hypothetical protein